MAVSFVELDYLLAEVVSAWFVKCLCFGVAMNPGAWSHHCDIDLAASLLRRKLRLTVRSILYNDNASRESRRWHVHGRIVPILLYFTQTENHSRAQGTGMFSVDAGCISKKGLGSLDLQPYGAYYGEWKKLTACASKHLSRRRCLEGDIGKEPLGSQWAGRETGTLWPGEP